MYKLLLSLLVLAFLGVAFAEFIDTEPRLEKVPSANEAAALFAKFKVDYNKSYATAEEEAKRFEYFQNKLAKIVDMNLNSETATFGIFRFDDESPEEKKDRLQNAVVLTPEQLALRELHKNDTVENLNINSIDWRTTGMISAVKNQHAANGTGHNCGDCWAFGATEMVEVANFQKEKVLHILSPQQFLDCGYGSCNGGNPAVAVQQMIQYQGGNLETLAQYPYIAVKGQCRYNGQGVGGHVSQVSGVVGEQNIYNQLNNGPLSVFMDSDSLHSYKSGYLTRSNCASNDINHVVQIVGTMYWSDGTPVWILKNQWGPKWATYGGYFYIAYGQGACYIQDHGFWAN